MQLGSGTYDFTIGSTFASQSNAYSFGSQIMMLIRSGENSNGYTLGNQTKLNGWIQLPITNELSTSFQSIIHIVQNINGSDDSLMTAMSPSNSTEQGYTQASIAIGMNYLAKSGFFNGNRAAIEYSIPVYTTTNTTQLIRESTLTLGIQRGL